MAAAAAFAAEVTHAMAGHPAAALVSAELRAVVASSPPGSASVSLEAPPTWRGPPAAAAPRPPLLLCLHCHVKTQHTNSHTRAVGTYMTPVKLYIPPAFETLNAGLAGAPIAALDVAVASAAGLALNSTWADDDRLPRGLRVDVVTGLIAQSSVSQLANWPALSGPPGTRLQGVLAELSGIFSDRPAGAPGSDPNPPPPFVRADAATLEKLGAAQTRVRQIGALAARMLPALQAELGECVGEVLHRAERYAREREGAKRRGAAFSALLAAHEARLAELDLFVQAAAQEERDVAAWLEAAAKARAAREAERKEAGAEAAGGAMGPRRGSGLAPAGDSGVPAPNEAEETVVAQSHAGAELMSAIAADFAIADTLAIIRDATGPVAAAALVKEVKQRAKEQFEAKARARAAIRAGALDNR